MADGVYKQLSLPKIQTVIFDFDGTLAELWLDFADMKRHLSELAAGYLGSPPTPPSCPALEWFHLLTAQIHFADSGKGREFFEEGKRLIVGMEMEAARKGRLFPFTRAVLKQLRGLGVKVGIITRNCNLAVNEVFPDWRDHCNCLLTRDHVARVKPHPSHLHRAIEIMNVLNSQTLMVGDHPLDIETGHRAGVFTAGVASGKISEKELLRSGADWTAADCAELIKKLVDQHLLP